MFPREFCKFFYEQIFWGEENRVLELLVLILSIVGRKSVDKIKSWLIYGFFSFIKVTKGNAMKFINFTSM